MKFITSTHLKRHGLTGAQYLEKYPKSVLSSEEYREKLRQKFIGREITWKEKISEGTKIGMHKPESWEKFQKYVKIRDNSRMAEHFQSHLSEVKAKIYTPKRNAKVSAGKAAWWADGRKGKRVEQLWGEDKGKAIRALKSEQTRGEKNPAYGKVYEATGWKVGYYKGKLFRGILEYSFYRYLEEQGKFDLLRYEPFAIPYEMSGRKRTYTPDFLVDGRLIEIKPRYIVDDPKEIFTKKCEAARAFCATNGLTFDILTECDFPQRTYSEAYADQNIRWIRR